MTCNKFHIHFVQTIQSKGKIDRRLLRKPLSSSLKTDIMQHNHILPTSDSMISRGASIKLLTSLWYVIQLFL